MKWLFLRSAHAGEGSTFPDPILDIKTDMWCGLFAAMVRMSGDFDGDEGLIAKYGVPMSFTYPGENSLHAVRSLDLGDVADDFKPDVIFDRGGYPEYHDALNRAAFKIYYGAGTRWNPVEDYDLILVDTQAQKEIVAQSHPQSRVSVIHKPAARCFAPKRLRKEYDLVYICNSPSESKGTKWLAERVPPGVMVLHIGPANQWFAHSTGHLAKKDIPKFACYAKAGIVCDDGKHDSGPRVISELLAMDIPVLLRNTVRTEIINSCNGMICNEDNFRGQLKKIMDSSESFTPRAWYKQNISMERVAEQIVEMI